MSLPVLYSFRRCPYAMRARLALTLSGISCELREVVLRNKPAELLQASPKGTVPVLITVSGQVIEQSLDIMLWALEQNDPQAYWPESAALRTQALELIHRNDGEFKMCLDRYKYPDRNQHQADFEQSDQYALKYRQQGAGILADMDQRIRDRGGYLLGPEATLADIALMPFVRQFAHTDKLWFAEQPWPDLQHWLAEWLESELMLSIMNKYAPWEQGAEPVLFGA